MKKLVLTLCSTLLIATLFIACSYPAPDVAPATSATIKSDGIDLFKTYMNAMLDDDYDKASEILADFMQRAIAGEITIKEEYHVGEVMSGDSFANMMKKNIAMSPAEDEIANIECTIDGDTFVIDYYYNFFNQDNFSYQYEQNLDAVADYTFEVIDQFLSEISDPEGIQLASPIEFACNFYSKTDESLLYSVSYTISL